MAQVSESAGPTYFILVQCGKYEGIQNCWTAFPTNKTSSKVIHTKQK